jgi:hypothetical protein
MAISATQIGAAVDTAALTPPAAAKYHQMRQAPNINKTIHLQPALAPYRMLQTRSRWRGHVDGERQGVTISHVHVADTIALVLKTNPGQNTKEDARTLSRTAVSPDETIYPQRTVITTYTIRASNGGCWG